jgi:queuosine precursor transporter
MQHKLLPYISSLFVAILMISNIVSTKITSFRGLTLDGGTLLFPLSYIFGDILTEIYGYKIARNVIWTGFFCLALLSINILIIGYLPAASDRPLQQAYSDILMGTPRIMFASLIAYLCGSLSNASIMAWIKEKTAGSKLRLRTISSTLVWQALDTVIFILIAFYGIFEMDTIIALIVSNYILKVGIEVLMTPVTYMVVGRLKEVDNSGE